MSGLNHGFSVAFWFGALFAVLGAGIAFFGMDRSREPQAMERQMVAEGGVGAHLEQPTRSESA